MFTPDFEIFDEEYTKKIKLIAKIDTVISDNSVKLFFIQSHGTNYVLALTSKPNIFGDGISNITMNTTPDFYDVVQQLNKTLSIFYMPENKNLIFESKAGNEIKFNTLTLDYTPNYSLIEEKQKFNEISYIDFMTLLGKEIKEDVPEEIDYINLFLKNTKKVSPVGILETRPRFVFGDGTSISIQASHFSYCTPRSDDAIIYESVECGFPSKTIKQLKEYAEEPGVWTETVYPYTPVSVLNEIVKQKGIDKDFEAKYLKTNIER